MKIKILVIFVIAQIIFVITPSSAFAGDEQNPEITDYENDMFKHPYFKVPTRSLKAIDILSAWFYENQNESNFLFITIKVVDLNYLFFLRSAYTVTWGHDVYVYTARLSTQFLGFYSIAVIQRSYPNKINFISASFDKENNLVTFKIPKNLIGNPQPGDILTRTRAGSAISTASGYILDFYFALDVAPNYQASGKNYIIQFAGQKT
jgi:hypothetical protein